MPIPYFYFPGLDSKHTEATLDEESSRHIIQVLRMKEGEQLRITDGKGNLSLSTIRHADKKKCQVTHISIDHQYAPKRKIAIVDP